MSVAEKPSKPSVSGLEKLTSQYLDWAARQAERVMAIELLREKYQLSLHECQGVSPEVVRERQKRYSEHLERLKTIWKREDEELEKGKT